MDKESILAKKNWSNEYPNYMAECEIHDAMDEYAESTAMAFAEWVMRHYYSIDPGYYSKLPKSFKPVETGYPIEYLYALYLTQQK